MQLKVYLTQYKKYKKHINLTLILIYINILDQCRKYNNPLIGVCVLIKRTNLDMITYIDGNFIPLESVQMVVQIDRFRVKILLDCFFYNNKKKKLKVLSF